MSFVPRVRHGAGEHDLRLALGLAAPPDDVFDYPGGRSDPDVHAPLDPAGPGQGRDVLRDEWPYRVDREIADQHEREVAGIGKPLTVELERALGIELSQKLTGQRPLAAVMLRECDLQRVPEGCLRAGVSIGDDRADARAV